MNYLPFFLNFLSFLLCFLSYLFSFLFTLFFFFYSVNTLFFDPLFRARQGSFYSACRDQCFTTLPLNRLCLVWAYLPTTKSVRHSPLLDKVRFVFSLFPSRHAPNGSPLNLDYFGWSVIPTGRTSQKGLGRNRKIDLFSFPHHQTIPPLPLTSGPWPHHVLYWLGTGWWCLGLARASLSDLSKSLPATHASAVT